MSEIKVNKISPRTNCGTVQLGDSGDTFTIPAGATITNNGTANNFGATGSVNWQTTVKTSGFTAVAGEGYFVDTTSGAISVNLPAGTAGAVVGFKDYAGTFDTNNLTLVQNGSDKIGGSTVNAKLTQEGIAVTLVFIDSTKGWLVTDSGLQSEAPTREYIVATGGNTVTTCGDFKIHSFTGPGTFTVCSVGNACGSNTVSYVVVAGGGGSSQDRSGGGGAGGYRESKAVTDIYTASPLNATAGPGYNLPVTATGFPIVVGAGGTFDNSPPFDDAPSGGVSSFSTITSAGGGGGGKTPGTGAVGVAGGSGSGAGSVSPHTPRAGGAGNTPPVSPPQGNPGGNSQNTSPGYSTGGGGGAGAAGGNGSGPNAGAGGNGVTSCITGSPVTRAGGGGGGSDNGGDQGAGGTGGGGVGGGGGGTGTQTAAGTGTANTGGGAGGTSGGGTGVSGVGGGSGIVIIRYKFQN